MDKFTTHFPRQVVTRDVRLETQFKGSDLTSQKGRHQVTVNAISENCKFYTHNTAKNNRQLCHSDIMLGKVVPVLN